MKLLSIILQNQKGDNLLIVTCNSFPLSLSVDYSHLIYSFIIDSYKSNLRVERCIPITSQHFSVNNITKEYILNVIVSRSDLMLAYDGLRKLTEYINKTVRVQNIGKKIVELFSVFEEFLYCRELPFGEVGLAFRSPQYSKKRGTDYEICNRFSHIYLQPEKRAIIESIVRMAKVDDFKQQSKQETVRNSKNFCIKIFEEEDINTDQVKENFMVSYKNRLFGSAFVRRKPPPIVMPTFEEEPPTLSVIFERKNDSQRKHHVSDQNNLPELLLSKKLEPVTKSATSFPTEPSIMSVCEKETTSVLSTQKPPEELQDSFQHVFQALPISPRPSIPDTTSHFNESVIFKVRMNQKLQLVLVNQKVKNVSQCGQITLEANATDRVSLMLISDAWSNKSQIISRTTPHTFKVKSLQTNILQIQIDQPDKPKGVIDYILTKDTFNYGKIPLMFVSSFETRKTSKESVVEFTFKYKVNDKWKGTLRDIDISVQLDQNLVFSDCKTNPMANSLKGKTITWKAKELVESVRGRLSLVLFDPSVQPKEIIKEIRMSMRAEKSLLPELDVELCSIGGATKNRAKKNLLIEYKIVPE